MKSEDEWSQQVGMQMKGLVLANLHLFKKAQSVDITVDEGSASCLDGMLLQKWHALAHKGAAEEPSKRKARLQQGLQGRGVWGESFCGGSWTSQAGAPGIAHC